MAQPLTHYQLLSHCGDDQLRLICERRRLPIPMRWEDGPEGRKRLLKTMVFHLEDHKRLSDALADLGSEGLVALKHLAETGEQPAEPIRGQLAALGLILPTTPEAADYTLAERVADALEDFDDTALSFQSAAPVSLAQGQPFHFSLALTSVLLRCVGASAPSRAACPPRRSWGSSSSGTPS